MMTHTIQLPQSIKERTDELPTQLNLLRLLQQSPYMRADGAPAIDPLRHLMQLDAAQIEALTRRGFIIGAGGLALGTALLGCEVVDETGAPTATTEGIRVLDRRGKAVVAVPNATRIVTVAGVNDLENVVALGITPVAYGNFSIAVGPWLDEFLDGAQEFDTSAEVNIELITTYNPDVIVSSYLVEETYDQLEAVAPLYILDREADWRDQLRAIAQLLGREEQATARIAAVEGTITNARQALRERAGEQLSFVWVFDPGTFSTFTSDSVLGQLLVEVGFGPLATPQEPGTSIDTLSQELVEQLDGDRLVLADFSLDGRVGFSATEDLVNGPLGQQIPARRGGVVQLSPEATAAALRPTAMSIPFLLDELVAKLT